MHQIADLNPLNFWPRRRVPHRHTPHQLRCLAERRDLRFDKLAPPVSLCPQTGDKGTNALTSAVRFPAENTP